MPIALLTDFGTKDYFVGAMKGVILTINKNAAIVDITHEVEPHDIRSAAFLLAACVRDFPSGTVFLCVVDPGVGSSRRAIVAESAGRYFAAPDNGLLSFVFIDESARVFEITNKQFIRQKASTTFHGRDIFAPAAAHLSLGFRPHEFGPGIDSYVRLEGFHPKRTDAGVEGEIIRIDRFGNLITNLRPADLPNEFAIEIAGRGVTKRVAHYAEIHPNELAALVGSADFIEISANMASAAEIIGVSVGEKLRVKALSANESGRTNR